MSASRDPDLGGRYEAIFRFVRRRTPSREDAEDVTQEIFADAARALAEARLNESAPTLAWLYAVARRRLIDRLRDEQRKPVTISLLDTAPSEERAYAPSVIQSVLEGLNQLEESQRRVIVLKLFEGRPFAEIAEIVGASEEACRARCSRGLAALRGHLTQKGVAP